MFTDNNIYPCFLEMYKNMGDTFEQCEENPDLYVHVATGLKKLLVVYCLKQQNHPIATAVIISDRLIDGIPSFNMLYGVDPTMTGLKLGTRVAREAVEQFRVDMSKAITKPKLTKLYVSTYVDINHIVSQKISRKAISQDFTIIRDPMNGRPQYYYKRLLEL